MPGRGLIVTQWRAQLQIYLFRIPLFVYIVASLNPIHKQML